jgi:C4-dicarboxylate-specific signal transduction histidine kinase
MLRPLIKARDELEIRVRERTAELEMGNEILQTEIAQHKQAEDKQMTQSIYTLLPRRAW